MKPSKRNQKAAKIDLYIQQVARPVQKGHDPNDRRYDRDVEREMRKIKPLELDMLLNDNRD